MKIHSDWLGELHGLLLLAVIATGIGGVATTVATLSGQPLEVEVASDTVMTGTPPGLGLPSSVTVLIEDPTAGQMALSLAGVLPRLALVITALVLLWRAIGRARKDDPFRTGLAGGLHRLGFLLIIGGIVTWLAATVTGFVLSDTVGGSFYTMDFGVPFVWAMLGFGLLAIGQIVRRGQAMRDDLDRVV